MASITLISIISLNPLWSKNVGLKSSDQGYICCTEDAETGSPAHSVLVRDNYSQLVAYSTSHVECYFLGRRERSKKGDGVGGREGHLRKGGMADPRMSTLPCGQLVPPHPAFPAGMMPWVTSGPAPGPVTLAVSATMPALLRACRECSALTAL